MMVEKTLHARAYAEGRLRGRQWVGPNGDGTLGARSREFIEEAALVWAPESEAYMQGFDRGRLERRGKLKD